MNVLLRSRSAGIVFVAVAAALWGMDAWIRQPLAQTTDVATIVFGEHLVLVPGARCPSLGGARS